MEANIPAVLNEEEREVRRTFYRPALLLAPPEKKRGAPRRVSARSGRVRRWTAEEIAALGGRGNPGPSR